MKLITNNLNSKILELKIKITGKKILNKNYILSKIVEFYSQNQTAV